MIIFTFDTEDAKHSNRLIYWLGTTEVVGEDEEHEDEIYEQLEAQTVGLA